MKYFNEWINKRRATIHHYACVGKWLKPKSICGHKLEFDDFSAYAGHLGAGRPKHVSESKWAEFINLISTSRTALQSLWVNSGVFCNGIKTYCPNVHEYMALANTQINLPWSMYNQPFEGFVLVIPEELLLHEQFDYSSYGVEREASKYMPIAVLARYDTDSKCVSMSMPCQNTEYGLSWSYCWNGGEDKSIESCVPSHIKHNEEAVNMFLNAHQWVVRATINACILLSQATVIRKGCFNEELRNRLLKKLDNKKLPEHIREINRTSLLLIPEIYGLEQHIRVYDEVTASACEATGDGVPHKPHWRRGHWAHQAFGEGRKERKLIFRKPTFVNAHLFAGELSNTRVSMSLGGQHK